MPLVRVSLNRGRSPEFRTSVGDAVHRALVETINLPAGDHFQLFTEYEPGNLVCEPGYLGIPRTDALVIIQITLVAGRTVDQKKELFKRIAELLQTGCGARPEDVFVGLIEAPRENWSFGLGVAQVCGYASTTPGST